MLKWLVVGVGDITKKRVLPAILAEPRSKLAGVVTRDQHKADPYHVPNWPDLEAALANCDADAVYVATPVFLHASQTIDALKAGRHVLCEKPMGMNYAEATAMQEMSVHCNRKLGIAYYRRMYPKVQRAKELIDSGAIGQPFFAEANSHEWRRELGWRANREIAGGGPLYDIASHRIDLINFLFGTPIRVTGYISTLVQPIEVEDNATVLLEYRRGQRGLVDVRWHSHVSSDEFRILGDEGRLDLSPLNGDSLLTPAGAEQIPAPQNLHYPCVSEFVSAVLDDAPLQSSGATALLTDWATEQLLKQVG